MSWYGLYKGRKLMAVLNQVTECWHIAIALEHLSIYQQPTKALIKDFQDNLGYSVVPVTVKRK